MNSVIYNPLEEFKSKFRDLHAQKTDEFFEELVKHSRVNPDENRETVRQYVEVTENLKKLRRKYNWMRFLRVIMIITVVLIPLVILKTTPKIKELRSEIANADVLANELMEEAIRQMRPLCELFSDRDCTKLVEDTIPLISFEKHFSSDQESDMILNYDFGAEENRERSTIDVLAGHYNENPFIFENTLVHTMGVETYHGYKNIQWRETYTGSDGKVHTRVRTQTLHASVAKPKPFYSTQVVLSYCSQGGPDLHFTRDATHLNEKSEKAIERYVKKGERKLRKKNSKSVKSSGDFMSMSNTDFEVLFDALDRTDEVQFRTLFTPLAQTNMTSLILSDDGYGDDFDFIKRRRTNKIVAKHSQGRSVCISAAEYISYSFDIIKESFITKNREYFKAVYFDLAPILAIPVYQERPVHSLKPIPDSSRMYSFKECEALANRLDRTYVVHPNTKTEAILSSTFIGSENGVENIRVSAFSYDIEKRVDMIPVFGGDGRYHDVPVPWDYYIPLDNETDFSVTSIDRAAKNKILAAKNNLCIFNSK